MTTLRFICLTCGCKLLGKFECQQHKLLYGHTDYGSLVVRPNASRVITRHKDWLYSMNDPNVGKWDVTEVVNDGKDGQPIIVAKGVNDLVAARLQHPEEDIHSAFLG